MTEPLQRPLASPPTTTAQAAWKRFCLFMARVFYGRFEIDGRQNIPPEGPVLLCANHVNALVDALVVQASCPRPIHPLARSGLFRNPLLRPLLRTIQAVPIYRRPKSPETAPKPETASNDDSFRRCYEYLGQNRTILIFPEGQSHSDPRLRALKTGAARLALGSLERNGRLPAVVPVGLTFTQKGRFRSSALVQFGPPILLENHEDETAEHLVRRLTAAITEGIENVTLNADSWEDIALLQLLERFFFFRRRGRRRLSDRMRSLRSLTEAHRWLRFSEPGRVAILREKLRRFERLCRRYGVQDYQLNLRYSLAVVGRFLFRSLLFSVLVFPLALWGSIHSALPFLATRAASRWSARGRDQYDTAGMFFGLFFFAAFWAAQATWVGWRWGLFPALLYAVTLPITATVALLVGRERKRIVENLRIFFLFTRHKQLRGYLRLKREELEVEIAQLTRLVRREDLG